MPSYQERHKNMKVAGAMSAVSQGSGGSFIAPPVFAAGRRKLKRKTVRVSDNGIDEAIRNKFVDLGFSYKLAEDVYGLDAVSDVPAVVSDEKFSIKIPFAASHGQDRIGDFFEVGGLDCTNHRRNPVCFVDHGKFVKPAIGKAMDEAGNYTVEILADRGLAMVEIFLAKGDPLPGTIFLEAMQVYELYKQKILRAGSVGYRILEAKTIMPNPEKGFFKKSQHLIRTELLEASAVYLPMNADATSKAFDSKWADQPLTFGIKSMLAPFLPEQKIWSPGVQSPLEAQALVDLQAANNIITSVLSTKNCEINVPQANAISKGETMKPVAAQKGYIESEPGNIPHGAYFFAEIHDHLHHIHNALHHHNLDNPKAVEFAGQLKEKVKELCGHVGVKFEEIYPDLEPIHTVAQERAADEGENREVEESAAGKSLITSSFKSVLKVKGQKDDDIRDESDATMMEGKHMKCIKAAAEHLDECGDAEGVSKMMKAAHGFHAKNLHEVHEKCMKMMEEKNDEDGKSLSDGLNKEQEAEIMKSLTSINKRLEKGEKFMQEVVGS